jgi:hypothetical protein
MTLHKLNPEREPPEPRHINVGVSFQHELDNLADTIVNARASGNQDLHRFLAIADGVVRAPGRKILFTTNLPNVGDIDAALLRPGRCFATVHTRSLTREEGARLAGRLCNGDPARGHAALASVFVEGARTASVAAIYRACAAASAPGRQI